MVRKKRLRAIPTSIAIAVAVSIAISGTASPAYAEEAFTADRAIVSTASTLGQENAALEYATVRSGDSVPAVVDMGIDAYAASPMTEGKRFSVFCISMVASLALMLGIFGLWVRRKNSNSR